MTFHPARQPCRTLPPKALQPPFSTIPCNLLYPLANALLPFPMVCSSPFRLRLYPVFVNCVSSVLGGCPETFWALTPSLSALATSHSSLATIPFRITSFADPHPLTLIESHFYKKHGGTLPPYSSHPTLPTHRNACKACIFMDLLTVSVTPGCAPEPPIRMEQIPRSRVFTGAR